LSLKQNIPQQEEDKAKQDTSDRLKQRTRHNQRITGLPH